MKKVFIYNNNDDESLKTKQELTKLLNNNDILVQDKHDKDTELVIAIGGDGTFLRAIKEVNYQETLILGINTGHLGFFADYSPKELDKVLEVCLNNNYVIQSYKTIKTEVDAEKGLVPLDPAMNDVFIKHGNNSITHLDLYIKGNLIESIAGDGLLISSSAGSTAYNYSLGGSIVDPDLDLLQITPVAASNNAVYRSLTSSLLSSAKEEIVIVPKDDNNTVIVVDGNEINVENIKKISLSLSDKKINIVRNQDYNFWNKVNSKFI